MTMTANQMRKAIAELEAEDVLSPQAAKRLREMKQALPELVHREEKKKSIRAKMRAEAAERGDQPTPKRAPVDDGLSGQAWYDFYTKYCDPKGLAPIKFADMPSDPKRIRAARRANQAIAKPVEVRQARAAKAASAVVRILGWQLATVQRMIELDDQGLLETTLTPGQVANVRRKLPEVRKAYQQYATAA